MVEQHFCLRWNNYRTNITAEFETLREGEHFVDVTLACDGRQLKAHKVVLSACSPYFKELLQGNPCSHPIIILRDVAFTHMRSLLEFMYAGEVNVSQAHLSSFLHTAEALKIRGLAESTDERKEQNQGCNSLSPLSALKSSLGNFGGISFGGLGPSLLERPLIPPLLSHSGDVTTTPHLAPPTAPSSATFATPSAGGSTASQEKCQGPVSLTVNDIGARLKGESIERKDTTSPLSLPPNKRLRIESRISHHPRLKDYASGDKNFESGSQNGCSYVPLSSNSCGSPTDTTATSKMSSNAAKMEEPTETIPKIEPLDPPVSDHEGSGGWPEDGEIGGLGRESPSDNAAPPDAESPSHHLLQALSSESHHPGEGAVPNPGPYPGPAPSREVPRSCPYCAKLISNFYNLKKHITTMHQAPAFYHACCHCSATFRTPEYLRKHLVNVHKYPVKKKK